MTKSLRFFLFLGGREFFFWGGKAASLPLGGWTPLHMHTFNLQVHKQTQVYKYASILLVHKQTPTQKHTAVFIQKHRYTQPNAHTFTHTYINDVVYLHMNTHINYIIYLHIK